MERKKEYDRLEDRKKWESDGVEAFLGVRENDASLP